MSAMLEEVYKEADVRVMDGKSVASTTQTIKVCFYHRLEEDHRSPVADQVLFKNTTRTSISTEIK